MPLTRRTFLKTSAAALAGGLCAPTLSLLGATEDPEILGQGAFRYRPMVNWGNAGPAATVNDCHAMIQAKDGRIFLLTNEPRNNVLIYDRAGKLLGTWTLNLPGAHGMTLVDENGEEFLYLTDHKLGLVLKTTLAGRELMRKTAPLESGRMAKAAMYHPTDVVLAPDGGFYVLDGYGTSLVFHYSPQGTITNVFGGIGPAPANLNEAHGGVVDLRDPAQPRLLITSRKDCQIRRFTLAGEYVDLIDLPNALPCDIIFKDGHAFIPNLREKDPKSHGFLTILDAENRIVSNPGAAPAKYDSAGKLAPLVRTSPVFIHPHGLLVDDENNLFIAQWNSGKTYPIKLLRAG